MAIRTHRWGRDYHTMNYRQLVKYFAGGAVVGLPVLVTFAETVGWVAKVDGKSMRPTLNPNGHGALQDVVWVSRWRLSGRQLQAGDIVAFRSPTHPGSTMIKRIIGLEGDLICSRNYKIRYVSVPRGHCWVEGDNPRISRDSNLFGPISLGLVYGLATHILWPPSRWQKLPHRLLLDQTKRSQSQDSL